MKSSIKAASSIGAVALVLAGTATAITPGLSGTKDPFGNGAMFDQWSVTSGTIEAAGCGHADFTCGAALQDKGFYMRLITDDATGEMYFQTIVTEFDAHAPTGDLDNDLAFSDENFVSGSNNSGILDKQRITQVQDLMGDLNTTNGTVRFENFTEIGTGWASDYLVLSQTIKEDLDDTTAYEDFQTDFIFHQDGYSTDADKGVGMKITQYVPIANDGPGGGYDRQDLVLVDLRGSYVPAGGSIHIDPTGFDSQNQLGGGTMEWNANDRIYATWIGQELDDVAGQQFGFVAYDNDPETSGNRIQSFTLGDSWHDVTKVPGDYSGDAGTTWSTSLWGSLNTTGTIGEASGIDIPFIKQHPLD